MLNKVFAKAAVFMILVLSVYFQVTAESATINLLSLENGGEVAAGSVKEIKWNTEGEVDYVQIMYSTNSGTEYPYVINAAVLNTGNYNWQVPNMESSTVRILLIAKDAQGHNLAADESNRDFSIIIKIQPPELIAVADTSDNTPTLRWENVDKAIKYHLQISSDADFNSLIIDKIVNKSYLPETTYTPTAPLPDGKIYWRVSSIDVNNREGDFSTADDFLIDTSAPDPPIVIDDGDCTSDNKLHASWLADDTESGIAEYKYAIGTSAGAYNIVNWTLAGLNTEVTHADLNLVLGQEYYFSVKAKNAAGLWSSYGSSDGIVFQLPEISATKIGVAPAVVSPARFVFKARETGENPVFQIMKIFNTGCGVLEWIVTVNADWLKVSPSSGKQTGEVILSVDIEGMMARTHNAEIVISAENASNTLTVPVILELSPSENLSIALISPEDGAEWPALSRQKIEWQTTGAGIGGARILVSYNSGDNYKEIAKVSNSGTFYWEVPNAESSTMRIAVFAENSSNESLASAFSKSDFSITPAQPPEPIMDLEVVVNGNLLLLTWSQSSGAVKYNIYGSENNLNDMKLLTSIPANAAVNFQYRDNNAFNAIRNPDKNYFYTVKAVNALGQEAGASNAVGEFDIEPKTSLVENCKTNWNLISIPLAGQDITNASELKAAIPNCLDAAYWDPDVQGYLQYILTDQGQEFNNFPVTSGGSYYVNINKNTIWSLAGRVAEMDFAVKGSGWSTIVAPLNRDDITNASELVQSLQNCKKVGYWNTDVQRHVVYESVGGMEFNNFPVMPGKAYCASNQWLAKIGNVPKIVLGTVRTSKGAIPKADKLMIEAYIKERPSEIIYYDNPTEIVYDSGNWAIQLAAFPTQWDCTEILCIQFSDAESGEVKIFEIELDNNAQNAVSMSSLQNAGDLYLPVFLSKFTGKYSVEEGFENAIILQWETEAESSNLGFYLYRSEERDGEYVRVNQGMIKGAGTSGAVNQYRYIDEDINPRAKVYFYYLEDIDFAGNSNKSKIIEVRRGIEEKMQVVISMQKQSALFQNYPNPFNPETWIPYQLAEDADVLIEIYDIRGYIVQILALGSQEAGIYLDRNKAAYWNGRNEFGEKVVSGVYFYTLKANEFFATKKMFILK